jgi:hypothetical protein
MKFFILALALMSFSAFSAEKEILACSTAGDALDDVKFIQTDDEAIIRISQMDESVEEFVVRSSFRNIVNGDSDTLIAAAVNSEDFGGATTNAILIRVLPGQKTAFLANNGMVFTLNCRK